MEVQIFQDKNSLGRAAAARGAAYIREALEKNISDAVGVYFASKDGLAKE